MTSGIDPEENFNAVAEACEKAAGEGAEMLFTPEMSLLLDRDRRRASRRIVAQEASPYPSRLQKLADTFDIALTVGAPVSVEGKRYANRQWLFIPDKANPTTYDKIHMFDVELASGETWRESSAYRPGTEIVVEDGTPIGRLGLTTCYDIRFPALFEELGNRSCDAIAIPAAFTVPTGKAHWHVLLRARAIEASAFVVAAAQVGKHVDGRETYGHSLVVDPWGEVLLDMGGDAPGLGFCEIDLNRIGEVRAQIPSLANRRKIPN